MTSARGRLSSSPWGPSHPSRALDLDTEEGRAFLQERLAFFALVGLLVQLGFFVLAHLALALTTGFPSHVRSTGARVAFASELSTQVLYLAVWIYARRGRRADSVLRVLDVLLVFLMCVGPALGQLQDRTNPIAPFPALLIVVVTLMARAVIVPSDPHRTLRLGLASALPLVFGSLGLRLAPPLELGGSGEVLVVVPVALWCGCAVALSALTSNVIYGLRCRVSEARRLGQYTLEHKLGEGGMGSVYKARHAMLRRPTAIKLLPPERSGARNLERFEREVQATALLSHPNTISIYDYGRTPDGIFYYVMEYLDGVDLDGLVRNFGPQHPGRVVSVLRQVAGALGEAHAVGLIHRDVKPGNVFLCERGGVPDVAKVLDFGLVRDLTLDSREVSASASDVLTGTPLYLSPEAITAPERVDARSDLYALGAVGYYLLSGHHPFEGATVVEVCTHHLHTVPERPGQRLGFALPADLEDLVMQCLEKDPARRPQSAAALDQELASLAPANGWGEGEAREWWRCNGAVVAELRRVELKTSSLPTLAVSLKERIAHA